MGGPDIDRVVKQARMKCKRVLVEQACVKDRRGRPNLGGGASAYPKIGKGAVHPPDHSHHALSLLSSLSRLPSTTPFSRSIFP
eukprot:scaffold8793_cov119-Isochrysis_galbana.AAC.4